jgi:hypothetical protein
VPDGVALVVGRPAKLEADADQVDVAVRCEHAVHGVSSDVAS